jgi:hypothetical protein
MIRLRCMLFRLTAVISAHINWTDTKLFHILSRNLLIYTEVIDWNVIHITFMNRKNICIKLINETSAHLYNVVMVVVD